MEEFQGQERKIIMVSTVRSSINYVKMDKDFNIGFLSNEKVLRIYNDIENSMFIFKRYLFLPVPVFVGCRDSMWP